MSEKEESIKIKKSPNPYLMLFVGGLITLIFTFGYDLYKSYNSKKIITVTTIDGENKIKPISDTDVLKIDYQLLKDSTQIKSFFEKTIILSNKGKEGLENIVVNIKSNDTLLKFLESPVISTDPKEINIAMDIEVAHKTENSHKITIPLLNPKQSTIIKYKAYSKSHFNTFDPLIGIHKKNIELEYNEGPIISKSEEIELDPFLLVFFMAALVSFISLIDPISLKRSIKTIKMWLSHSS